MHGWVSVLGVKISSEAEAALAALPAGLRSRIHGRLEGIAHLAARSEWQSAFTGVRGLRALESVLDGFAIRYVMDAAARAVVLLGVEDRRAGVVRLPA